MRNYGGCILFLAIFAICSHVARSAGDPFVHLIGHYSDADLAKGASPTTLPRTYLYDANNQLVSPENWPAELAEVKKHIGDAYCCVSDDKKPDQGKEPPADCVRVVYGTDVAANFVGLTDSVGRPIQMHDLPRR